MWQCEKVDNCSAIATTTITSSDLLNSNGGGGGGGGGSETSSSFQRGWSEVQRYLLDTDWLSHYSGGAPPRDYGYLLGFLRQFPALAADRFGGYSGGAATFQFMEWEKNKKAYPLAYLLAARAPLEVIEEVYGMYPSVVGERQGEQQGSPLHIACSHGVGFDVIQFLVHVNESAVNEYDRNSNLPLHLVCKSRNRGDQSTTTDTLQILQLLLSKNPTSLTKENRVGVSPLVYALKNDTTQDSVMTFLVDNLPSSFGGDLKFNGLTIGDRFAFNLRLLIPKLRMLILKSCQITAPHCLVTFLTNPQITNLSLALVNCKIRQEEEESSSPSSFVEAAAILPEPETPLSGIRQLTINNCYMKDTTFHWLLDQIILQMDQLKELTLTNPSQKLRAVNITNFAVAILRRTPTTPLTNFSMDGHALALQALIDVLANENRVTYVEYKNNVHDPHVKYYSTMNRFGRSCMQNPNTSKDTIIEHLRRLHLSVDRSYATAIAYGLLRESVPLWSD